MFVRLNYHLDIPNPDAVSTMEEEFAAIIKAKGDEFKFYQDQYGEHPDERAAKNEQKSEKLGDIQTLTTIYNDLKAKVNQFLIQN